MYRFITRFLVFVGLPILILILIYIISDPFKMLYKFDLNNVSTVNRDYLSTELFLKNNQSENYNSFIFGSSRACGFNSYQWKKYLPKKSNQFVFQAWGESITGIYQKINYVKSSGNEIKNAIILIDIPGSFSKFQEPTNAVGMKHYKTSGMSKLKFQSYLFLAFLKPSQIYQSSIEIFKAHEVEINFDSISNDWFNNNKFSVNQMPNQNYELNKDKFHKRKSEIIYSTKLIDDDMKTILINIKHILNLSNSTFKIIISPSYDQIIINKNDLSTLKSIFGSENVFNYTGRNNLTEDKYNFSDVNHFDLIVGWKILENIYENKPF